MRLLPPAPPRKPEPAPLEVDDPRVVGVILTGWLLGLVGLGIADLSGASVPGWQLWMCVAGAGLGVLGVRAVRRRQQVARR